MSEEEDLMREVAGAIVEVFSVFKMFNFKEGDDIRLGGFMHLFEAGGASRGVVDSAISYMIKKNWLAPNTAVGVRPGGHTLTAGGVAAMEKFLG